MISDIAIRVENCTLSHVEGLSKLYHSRRGLKQALPLSALQQRHGRAPGLRGAAHLGPEILLVDEVLAVGDGAFQ